MKTLISQVKIIDKRHPDNGQVCDILIEDGVIKEIASSIKRLLDAVNAVHAVGSLTD